MNKITLSALLLSVALVSSGCNTVPQPQPTQTGGSNNPSATEGNSPSVNEKEYNRNDGAGSQRHRHHRNRGHASDDSTSYDRAETAAEPSGSPDPGAYQPRQSGPQSTSGGPRSSRHHNSRAHTSAPGQFDFYVLNLSWSPEFCHVHPAAAECAQHRAFTLHGLWPQNNDGTYPEDCSQAPGPASPSQYADIYPDSGLLQHEWQTHGTCSGLDPDPYFTAARRAERSIQIPAPLSHPTQQTIIPPAQIIALFTQSNPAIPASSLAISCGNNYLTAVEVCLDKNLKPESCSAVKTCGANQIRIPAPQ